MSDAPRVELSNTNLSDLSDINADLSTLPANRMGNAQPPMVNENGSANQASTQQTAGDAKNSILETAQNTMASIQNHPSVQNAKETVLNGPVAQQAKAEGAKTRDEFADLANSKQIPEQKTATGQNLTHYHSMFYRLLSWKNPRATGISFAAAVLFIFAARYLNVVRYIIKLTWIVLGITAAAEVAGQAALGKGLTSQFRPRQYFTIPKASLERLLDDVEQLINFFVIESQRIVFAENVYVTIAAFFASLISYFLIKFVPMWGLALIATVTAYIGPLVYIQNKEVIDAQLEKGRSLASQQATQIRDLASKQAANASQTVSGLTQQYTTKAQETINNYRGRSPSAEVKKEDFPSAPKTDIKSEPVVELPTKHENEPPLVPQTAL
jgi:ABC-type multidrug transport system fused ATPase/permease subunit